MKKQKVFLLFASLTALLFCGCSSELKEKENASSKPGTVTLSIANDTQRTISPASGISYKNVSEWTVTFEDITESRSEKYNDIVKTVSFSESANQQIQLPLGTYNVTLNGTANNATSGETATTQTVPFYGESTVTVEDGKSASVSVFVSPKKTGTGSFSCAINISGIEDYPPAVDGDTNTTNHFTATLIPYAQSEKVSLTASVKKGITDNSYILTVTNTTVPSGFYKLSIEYEWKTGEDEDGSAITDSKEVFYPYHDFLVEITDDLKTTGETSLTISIENSKTYYATTGESKGNGAFKSYPKKLDALLDDINSTTISTANIYLVDEATAINSLEIDISKIKSNIERNIFAQNENGGMYQVYSVNLDNDLVPTITLCNDVNFVTLTSISDTFKKANLIYTQTEQIYCTLKKDTSIIIDNPTTDKIKIENTEYNSYYAEHPCVTVKNSSYDELTVSVDKDLENTYTVVTKTSTDGADTITEYYIIPSATASSGVTGIPAYSLAVTRDGVDVTTSTLLYAGDTVVITAAPAAEGGAFAQGTTFAWFVNRKKVECTNQYYEITFGQDDVGVTNSILCLAGYNGKYATAETTLTAVENTVVLYNNTADTAKPALSYATLTGSSISSPSELLASNGRIKIQDFCFDASNNYMYAVVYDGSAYSINKYEYKDGYTTESVTTYTCSEQSNTFDYIEASSDGTLYAVITSNTGTQYIAKLTLTDPTETSENGTIQYTQYSLPSDWTSDTSFCNIFTFCTDGTNFYVIATTGSSDSSTSEVKLASCTVSDSNLTENASIKLDSITNENRDTGNVFSDYSVSLEYRDLCYINGKLYLLVRDVELLTTSQDSILYSRGALCTFTVSDSGITAGKIGIGYQTTSSTVSYTGYNSSTNQVESVSRTTYFGDSNSKLFYGPVKFVARKEDELIIADDGYSLTPEDYNSGLKGTVSSKNAVVTFDLNEQTLNFATLDGEYFENKYSGYFYGSNFTDQ
ncbi:hypothetical protein [Treponema porcinum]|uniref:hypothetical protein n=1 Tax=Treponema porcinum TaxID=261392 RepID=UPI003F010AB9